jgi:hypothetical protein
MLIGFGLYVTAIGVGLVIAALIVVMILSKILTGVFKEESEPIGDDSDGRKIAAVAAVLASMDEHPDYRNSTLEKVGSQWEAAARMEAIDRRHER